jgi:hypothetical protein
VLAVLGAARGPAEESTFRRAFALAGPGTLDQVLGAWLRTRPAQAGGRMVIAAGGKAARGAKDKAGKARTWSRRWRTASARFPARSP